MRHRVLLLFSLLAGLTLASACDWMRPAGRRQVAFDENNLARIEGGWFVLGGKPRCRDEAVPCTQWQERKLTSLRNRLFPWRLIYQTGFFIEKREVTNAEYLECVQHGACEYPGELNIGGNSAACYFQAPILGDMLAGVVPIACRFTRDEVALEPIRSLTWRQARKYCKWRYADTGWTADLPTEAMWERAAVGGAVDGRSFAQPALPGAQLPERLNCDVMVHNVGGTKCVDDEGTSSGVVYGQNAKHPFAVLDEDGALRRSSNATAEGVVDLAGNVAEWVLDASEETAGDYDCSASKPFLGVGYSVDNDCECVPSARFEECDYPWAFRLDLDGMRLAAAAPQVCNPVVGVDSFGVNQDKGDQNADHVVKGGSYETTNWCELSPRARRSLREPDEGIGFRCAVLKEPEIAEAKKCDNTFLDSAPPLPRSDGGPCDAGYEAGPPVDASPPDAGADS
ncbi:MAG: SUMF1/EgtB/PvdO family nonheme iron enzyme [Deltaproteobacteria bacterium]|nr:SUMF1/EgtB/PvdO family nonheme iron enzyme [Deltaproteobacteria bacterium]